LSSRCGPAGETQRQPIQRADYFKVRAANDREYLLKHDLESDEWFLGQEW